MLLIALAILAAGPVDHAAARKLIDRAQMCQHWAGEEAYDKARAREIDRGVRRAGCDTIEREAKAFLRRHPAPRDARALRRALAGHD